MYSIANNIPFHMGLGYRFGRYRQMHRLESIANKGKIINVTARAMFWVGRTVAVLKGV